LLSARSLDSEICRAEQLRALRKGKCVIPLLAQKDCEIPLHLETKNWLDLSLGASYADQIAKLIAHIDRRAGVHMTASSKYWQTYVTAPPLLAKYFARAEAVQSLRDSLVADEGDQHIALIALEGMGGYRQNRARSGAMPRRSRPTGLSQWCDLGHDWRGTGR
jgi:hypothetical protein